MKSNLLIGIALFSAISLQAQVYKVDTAFTTDIGSGGAKASCAARNSKNNTYGINHNRAFFFLLGEDFVVPAGQTWNLDTVIIYGYQTGSGITSTMTQAVLEIRQSSVIGSVVFGDTTTNRLVASDWTGIYRVDSSAAGLMSIQRPIMRMKIKLTPAKTLTAGTYWMIWGCRGSGTGGVFCPPKVNPGRNYPGGQNAMQRTTGSWHAAVDTVAGGNTQVVGFSYMLKGPQKPAGIGPDGLEPTLLAQNQPNPFSGSTTIAYTLPQSSRVKLDVYSSVGQHVSTLAEGRAAAGPHEVHFNAAGVASGKYFYRLQTEAGVLTKQMDIVNQ